MRSYEETVKKVEESFKHKKDMNSDLVEYSNINLVQDKLEKIFRSPALSSNYGPKTKNVVVSFDTETTNAVIDGEKRPYIYSYALTVMDIVSGDNVNIHCTKLNEFKNVVRMLCIMAGCHVSSDIKTDKDGHEQNMYTENGTDDHNNYDDSNDIYLNIYVHNLPFDYAFLMKAFDIRTLFCSATHRPYYVLTWCGAKFIDTVVLTQKTLEQLGNDLTMFNIKKQVGDLDYRKIRTSDTTFTKKERGYIVSDTMVLAAYMVELCRKDYDLYLCRVPLTQTGKVRNYLQKLCHGNINMLRELIDDGFEFNKFNGHDLNGKELKKANAVLKDKNASKEERENAEETFSKFKTHINNLYKKEIRKRLRIDNLEDYFQMKKTYSGGYTHANVDHVEDVVDNVASFDFTSSYPTVMVSEEYPMSHYIRVKYDDVTFLKKLKNAKKDHKCYFFEVTFDSLKQDYSAAMDSYLSDSKVKATYKDINGNVDTKYISEIGSDACAQNGIIVNNGRVVNACKCSVYTTSVDWEIISKVYKFGHAHFSKIMQFGTGYLPTQMIISVLHFYEKKTTLKHVKGQEHQYMLYKEQLNSLYGMTVQDPINDVITYHDSKQEWTQRKAAVDDKAIDGYNNSQSRFLYYPWGIMIAAYARRNLWTGIIECGNDYIYSDTDSIKIKNKDKHLDYIEKYNQEIVKKLKKTCRYYDIPYDKMAPKDINGNRHQLGIWDADDGFYSHFKTLGAKRYIDISKDDNSFECTIAGLPKKNGAKWMINKAQIKHDGTVIKEANIEKLFDVFDNEMTIPENSTGKLTHTYVDKYNGFDITDYQGHKTHIPAGMGCFLSPASFTLSLSEKFLHFLKLYLDNKIEIEKNGFML